MALFSRTKKTPVEATAAPKPATLARATDRDLTSVIISPVVTEKAVLGQDSKVYTFFVRKNATKYDVHDAVVAYYNVTPVKVNIVNKAPRKELAGSRGRMTHRAGYKKAYVYVRPNDTINLV